MTPPLVYDASMLIGVERRDKDVWAVHTLALKRKSTPIVPAPVLAQVWRGGPQPDLSRFLNSCDVVPMDDELARQAGRLCGLAGTSDVVDACVVAVAVRSGAAVHTGDPQDIRRLVTAAGVAVPVDAV